MELPSNTKQLPMKKYKNKYRIESARLKNWDYGSNGAYFLTICTAKREHYFGGIQQGKMNLNEMGILAQNYWMEIPVHFPYVKLGNFVIMPDHVHGVLIIDKINNDDNDDDNAVEARLIAPLSTSSSTSTSSSLPKGGVTGNKNPMFHENISRIIRWYKGRCTFEIRKIHPDFGWQPRFHDHIIRNKDSFNRIQNYITNNPSKWDENKFK